VLEKHADFLRDFRGDTVHASTLTLLDELGLGERFADLPARWVEKLTVELDSGTYGVADLSRLRGPHRHIALVPQWDLLNVIADASSPESGYELIMEAAVTDLLWDGSRVMGVIYTRNGADHRLEADLVVGCDGRSSAVRERAGLSLRTFGVPMDVLWFRLPRLATDPAGIVGRISRSNLLIMIDRGDYYQIGFVIRKGSIATLHDQGIEAFLTGCVASCRGSEIAWSCCIPSTRSNCSMWCLADCRAGIGTDCCASAMLLTRCHQSVVSASTLPSRTPSRRVGFSPNSCETGRCPPGVSAGSNVDAGPRWSSPKPFNASPIASWWRPGFPTTMLRPGRPRPLCRSGYYNGSPHSRRFLATWWLSVCCRNMLPISPEPDTVPALVRGHGPVSPRVRFVR